ncbi:MAG TPA: replication-associated recombination protein A [Thermoanaerobacterales bacterium]|nr:replication-associated recombination protein A [Thermoanaerobacterales bacterium]
MDLFEYSRKIKLNKDAPLAERMRPRSLEEFIGQKEILGDGKLLYRAIETDKISSLILYGPPGTGKTTLALIIANTTSSHFEQINAVTSGISDIRRVIKEARERLAMYHKKTVLFIDEIHRFNKAQQDALLPSVEEGTIILIGATTENPYFEIISPLISRSRVFQFNYLTFDEVEKIIQNALRDKDRGLGNYKIKIDEGAITHIVNTSNGDARTALNALELAFLTTPEDKNGICHITLETAEESIQRKALIYDKNGDNHYDTISAFIKSMRGGDPDAALYWLAKMIYAGEDPLFIARRIVICASEDVGNADPNALNVAVSAAKAVEFIGMPEGKIPLAQAAIYVACAPKSNAAYKGIENALKDIKDSKLGEIPQHLINNNVKGTNGLEKSTEYKYPHDYEGSFVKQEYLPKSKKGKRFYYPTENGFEKIIKERLIKWHKSR